MRTESARRILARHSEQGTRVHADVDPYRGIVTIYRDVEAMNENEGVEIPLHAFVRIMRSVSGEQ